LASVSQLGIIFGLYEVQLADEHIFNHKFVESITINFRLNAGESVWRHVSIPQCQPFSLKLLSLVVLLQKVYDTHPIVHIAFGTASILNEFVSSRLEL
jgi:hypothetical protein